MLTLSFANNHEGPHSVGLTQHFLLSLFLLTFPSTKSQISDSMNKTPAVHQLLSYMNTYKRRIFPTLARRILMDSIYKQDSLDSIIFFTSHKCASVFVPRILRALDASSHSRLKAIDYASEIWSLSDRFAPTGEYEPFLEFNSESLYSSKSFIYGPQRKPFSFEHRKIQKYFSWDPRDVVVSAFSLSAVVIPCH